MTALQTVEIPSQFPNLHNTALNNRLMHCISTVKELNGNISTNVHNLAQNSSSTQLCYHHFPGD